ncbi:sortase [Paenibacillus pectinilyticus]|uniref:Sortase n=1 Tax=Paenibacillus pectinilyticus TaxID=512399 RepID=A0A1C0ZYT0_9BACL|nr:sortase [Paenibacillus pectinilyticus]OCT13257.1 sortase [Paenibacillus pectinilyticus]
MIRRVLPPLLILLGILIFLYPTFNDRYESYQQKQILKQWQDNMQAMDQTIPEESEVPSPIDALVATSLTVPSTPVAAPASVVPATSTSSPPVVKQATPKPVPMKPKNMEGVLSIAKIDLKLPILTDATMENMKVAVASIVNTGKAGAIGNYAIAGHRNLTYGKNFNRLDEVEPGDLIGVDTGNKQYVYKVEEKLYVLPTDVWVLQGNDKDREITLITCDPMVDPTHRLIVKGKLVE